VLFVSQFSGDELLVFNKLITKVCTKLNEMFITRIIHEADDEKLCFSTCLLIKASNTFEAICLLIEKDLTIDAKALVRNLIEDAIVFKNICLDESFFEEYIKCDILKQLPMINSWVDNFEILSKYNDTLKEESFRQRKKELDNMKNENNPMQALTKIKELAKRAKLEGLYEITYRLLCEDVHVNPRSLQEYFLLDMDNTISGYKWKNQNNDRSRIIITALDSFLLTMECMAYIFALEQEDALIKSYHKELVEIGESIFEVLKD